MPCACREVVSCVHHCILTVADEQDYDPITPFTSPLFKPFVNERRLQCFNITIIDDNLFEQTENFTLMVTPFDDTPLVRITPNVSIIEIVDNDSKSHTLSLEGSVGFSKILLTSIKTFQKM